MIKTSQNTISNTGNSTSGLIHLSRRRAQISGTVFTIISDQYAPTKYTGNYHLVSTRDI